MWYAPVRNRKYQIKGQSPGHRGHLVTLPYYFQVVVLGDCLQNAIDTMHTSIKL